MLCLKEWQIRFQIKLLIKFERASNVQSTKATKTWYEDTPKHIYQSLYDSAYCVVFNATIVMQSDLYPQKWTFLLGNVYNYIFACNQPLLSFLHKFQCLLPKWPYGTALLFYFRNLIGQKYFVDQIWTQDRQDCIALYWSSAWFS